ncbi:MAG: iron-containing alcohol dehydrogenase [Pseudomonadota bacterium]
MSGPSNFSFTTITQLICQRGAARHLGQHVRALQAALRVCLLVTDAGLRRSGLIEPACASLRAHGFTVHVFADVLADPPAATVLLATEFARSHGVELVIGLGGGSSMDVAKLVAILAGNDQALDQIYGIGKVQGQRLPLVQVPTTAGTGSEATNIAIVTTGETSKMGVVASQLYADLAILDAELTLGLPPHASAATGIDAMVHAIEAYTSRHKKNPISDMLARQALALLSANLLKACENGDDLEAREAMLLGAYLAGTAFSNAPVAAVHALAYPIGGLFHVAHGLSNSLVLPHVLRFNLPVAFEHYAELASIVVPHASGSSEARAEALIVAMHQISAMTGIQTTLQQVGVKPSDLDRLAADAMLQTRLLANNPRELALADARAIYAAAY